MLGVSTMPVREALLKLAALGLVEASPNRSFRVVNSTKEDTRDSYWMQSVLVGELTRRACTLEGPKLVPELESKDEPKLGHDSSTSSLIRRYRKNK